MSGPWAPLREPRDRRAREGSGTPVARTARTRPQTPPVALPPAAEPAGPHARGHRRSLGPLRPCSRIHVAGGPPEVTPSGPATRIPWAIPARTRAARLGTA